MSRNVKELEEKIGYNFKDSHLLRHAVTHSSYVNEKHMKKADCNERLEFLGDAVLELISSEYLFFENQTMPEVVYFGAEVSKIGNCTGKKNFVYRFFVVPLSV